MKVWRLAYESGPPMIEHVVSNSKCGFLYVLTARFLRNGYNSYSIFSWLSYFYFLPIRLPELLTPARAPIESNIVVPSYTTFANIDSLTTNPMLEPTVFPICPYTPKITISYNIIYY